MASVQNAEDAPHVVIGQTQAVMTAIRLSEEMRAQIQAAVVNETRAIARERFLLIPRIAAMYLSGVATVVFAALVIVASMFQDQSLSVALVTPTLIAAISSVTLAFVLHKGAQ